METYFLNHTREIGSLIYNADYSVKYLKKYQYEGEGEASYNDIHFLHGDRKNFVRSWITDRLRYLDSVWDIGCVYDEKDLNQSSN